MSEKGCPSIENEGEGNPPEQDEGNPLEQDEGTESSRSADDGIVRKKRSAYDCPEWLDANGNPVCFD